MNHQLRRILAFSVLFVSASVPDCTRYCTTMILCANTIELEFNPPIHASDAVTITVTGDDTNLTGSFSREAAFGPITLWSQNSDGGGFVVTSASAGDVMPKHISYVVVADGVTVASGDLDPQYQHYTRGSEDCRQNCTTAYVTVPVTQ